MKNFAAKLMYSMRAEEGREYMFKILTYSLAPVIFGEKCASLLCISDKNKSMYEMWKRHREEYLNMLTLSCYEIGGDKNNYTLIFYKEELLRKITEDSESADFLSYYGYLALNNPEACFEVLKSRLSGDCPHEMGLLLGIPIYDVKAFIKNSGRNYLYCGYWKVYHNLNEALNTFQLYEKASEEIAKLLVNEKNTSVALKILRETRLIDLRSSVLYN